MASAFLLFIGIVLAAIHFRLGSGPKTRARAVEVMLLYVLVFGTGFAGAVGFVGHVFFADRIAGQIGWPAGNPFQFEVGIHDGAWGVLGFLCIWHRGKFWLATGLGWSLFLLGAAFGHIRDAIIHRNYAPYNFGMIFPDVIIPLLIFSLLTLYSKHTGFASRSAA